MVGTVNYMAPEQLRGERADHRADIFSFGVLLYELLGGRKPFQGDSAASTMYKILHEVPQALDELDPALGPPLTTLVDRAMAKARDDRYQRMTDLLRDLEAAYEPMRGADRRVDQQGRSGPAAPVGFKVDHADRRSTIPTTRPRLRTRRCRSRLAPSPPAPPAATPAPSPARPRRGLASVGALSVGLLILAGWFIVGRQASSPAEARPPRGQPRPPLHSRYRRRRRHHRRPSLHRRPRLPRDPAPINPPAVQAPRTDADSRQQRDAESARKSAIAIDRTHAADGAGPDGGRQGRRHGRQRAGAGAAAVCCRRAGRGASPRGPATAAVCRGGRSHGRHRNAFQECRDSRRGRSAGSGRPGARGRGELGGVPNRSRARRRHRHRRRLLRSSTLSEPANPRLRQRLLRRPPSQPLRKPSQRRCDATRLRSNNATSTRSKRCGPA